MAHTQTPLAMKAAAAQRRVGVRRSAQLDLLRVHFMRCLYLSWIRIDKKTCQYSRLSQAAHSGAHDSDVGYYIEAAFGSYFVCTLRNKRNRIRPHVQRDL